MRNFTESNASIARNVTMYPLSFCIERNLPPTVAVYALSVLGLTLHVVVLKRRFSSDDMSHKYVLLKTLSLVDIALSIHIVLAATLHNNLVQSAALGRLLNYSSSIIIYHSLLINFITFDSFLKIRLAFYYDEEKMEKYWVFFVIFASILTLGSVIVHDIVFPFLPQFLMVLQSLLLFNLICTYVYIMHKMLKLRLDEPQVIGFFSKPDGSEPDQSRKNATRRLRFELPPSFKKIIYSLPMQILLIHTMFLIVPSLITLNLWVQGKRPSIAIQHFLQIVACLAVCSDAVIYLFISNKMIRHIFSSSRIKPTPIVPPSKTSQPKAATINVDYSWAITNFNSRVAWGISSNSKKYEV